MILEKRTWSIGFTNFFGVFNDNAFKTTTIFVAVSALSDRSQELGISAMVMTVFILPFVLFPTVSGWLSDRFSRHKIMQVSKFSEIVIMLLGSFVVYRELQNPELANWPMYFIVFLMSMQSTFFSPARNTIIPQLFSIKEISNANGVIELIGFSGVILGTAMGGFVLDTPNLIYIFPVIAVLGFFISLCIPKVNAENPTEKFNWNIPREYIKGLQLIRKPKGLFFTILGDAYFCAFGSVILIIIFEFAKYNLIKNGIALEAMSPEITSKLTSYLLGAISIGMGLGCYAAGKFSKNKIELGLVPVGIAGIMIFTLVLYFCTDYYYCLAIMGILGFFSGLYVIPLRSYIQEYSDDKVKGKILATSNLVSFVFMLFSSFAIYVLSGQIKFSFLNFQAFDSKDLLLFSFALTFVGTAISFYMLPDFLFRFVVVTLTRTVYRMRVINEEVIPKEGPVLLLPNHVTWVDGMLISAATSRPVRFMVGETYYNKPIIKPILKWLGFIPVPEKGSKAIIQSLKAGKEALENGDILCIFPEGRLTRSGLMHEFKNGFSRMLPEDKDVTILPIYMGMIWGSIFSKIHGEELKIRMPKRFPYPMTVSFGEKLPRDVTGYQARQAVMHLQTEMEREKYDHEMPIHSAFVSTAHYRPFNKVFTEGSDGKTFSNFALLTLSMVLRGHLKKNEPDNEEYIGLIVPTSSVGVASALSVMYSDKIPVYLNYTASTSAIEHAIDKCKMKRVLTSKLFLKKIKFTLPDSVQAIYLEDIVKSVTTSDKLKAACASMLPLSFFRRKYMPKTGNDPFSTATVLFSSGSTGTPKGVVLTHHNLTSNLTGLLRICGLNKNDMILGNMPLFHSFGFLSAFWLPVMSQNKIIYYPNPLDGGKICELIETYKLHVLFGTPTFLNTYARKAKPKQLDSLKIVLSGAEKLRKAVAEKFHEVSGVYPIEAYGATELSPGVSINIPLHAWDIGSEPGPENSVGHPIPGVTVKIIDLDTKEELGIDQEGLLMVTGPNVMTGYLDEPEKTAEVLQDGWYNTGDMAKIDKNGYITLTGRLSRFSKIAGEMVPHGGVEEIIQDVLEITETLVVVSGIPDKTKGEKLIVYHTEISLEPMELVKKMKEKDIPNLWVPKANDFIAIDEIPLLGSGKVDFKAIQSLSETE